MSLKIALVKNYKIVLRSIHTRLQMFAIGHAYKCLLLVEDNAYLVIPLEIPFGKLKHPDHFF